MNLGFGAVLSTPSSTVGTLASAVVTSTTIASATHYSFGRLQHHHPMTIK